MAQITTDTILQTAAGYVRLDLAQAIAGYEQTAEALTDLQPDPNFLLFARQYDQARVKKLKHARQQARRRSIMRIAAVFCVCIVTLGSLTLGTSEAARRKAFHLLFDTEGGGVTMLNTDPPSATAGWHDYWYPGWLPEGYALMAAETDGTEDPDYFLSFVSSNMEKQLIVCEYSLTSNLSIDTDHTVREEVMVGDAYGQLFRSKPGGEKALILVWQTDNKLLQINLYGSDDESVVLKIAENMQFFAS